MMSIGTVNTFQSILQAATMPTTMMIKLITLTEQRKHEIVEYNKTNIQPGISLGE